MFVFLVLAGAGGALALSALIAFLVTVAAAAVAGALVGPFEGVHLLVTRWLAHDAGRRGRSALPGRPSVLPSLKRLRVP